MPTTLAELKRLGGESDRFVRQALPAGGGIINAPAWDTFRAEGGIFSVILKSPVQDNGEPYGLVGSGAEYEILSASAIEPVFFYQVQLASNAVFTSNVTTHDIGTSRIADIKLPITATRFARARARVINSDWSEYSPAPNSSVSGPAFTSAHTSYRPTTNPLTATDAGATATVSVAAFTMRVAGTDISVNSGSITGLSFDTLYFVFYDDANFAGGAVTYQQSTTKETALSGAGRFFVGSIRTPRDEGSDTIGNDDGGTGAQSGQTEFIPPSNHTAFTQGIGTTVTNPTNARDFKPNTFATLDTAPDTANQIARLTVHDFFSSLRTWKTLKIRVCSEVTVFDTNATAPFARIRYSVNNGTSWTNIYSVTTTRALILDTVALTDVTLPLNFIRVEAEVNSDNNTLGAGITMLEHEVWLEGVS